MRTLASFKDIHRDGTIVVCGCGSSLNSFERPERFVTIGVNDVGRLFQPNYLVVVDPKERFKGDRFHYVETSRAEYLFTQVANLRVPHPNIVPFRLGRKDGTDFLDSNVLNYGVISPYVALCLAVHMGARYIGVIGVDFTDNHFFGNTGRHAWSSHLTSIDEPFRSLRSALLARGIAVFNLSQTSRLTAFPKMALDVFASLPSLKPRPSFSHAPLRIVSYATTPVVGVPAILERCINARTSHSSRCIWARDDYGNGATFDGDISWRRSPDAASAELAAADVVIVHNGRVDPQHSDLIAGKAVITMAHNSLRDVDQNFVHQGFPGIVVGQYQATLPEFKQWSVVPNPVPLWEGAFALGDKSSDVTICYTPAGKRETYPPNHGLYWYAKGYDTTMRVLDKLNAQFPIRLEVIREQQVSHAEALAMKRRAHIVIDECVTGSYHRNSLEGLACGCVVVNGVGLLPGVTNALRHCAGGGAPVRFVQADLETLEAALIGLIEQGPGDLAYEGAINRLWMEQHWDFAEQWTRFWQPVVECALGTAARVARSRPRAETKAAAADVPRISVVVVSLNEGDYLRRTVASLMASMPADSEIIVVDDGSTDGSADFLGEPRQRLTFLRSSKRLGAPAARNWGAGHARGKFLVFSDAHVAVPRDWVDPIADALAHPDVGAIMPAMRAMRNYDDYAESAAQSSKEARGFGLKWRDAALGVSWLGPREREAYPVPLLGAAFLGMRRNLFAAIGGFDMGFEFWGSEDAELSFRLWTLGYECRVVPQVDVAHSFRSERPYVLSWESVLYNKLRLATIHFAPERRNRVVEELQKNAAFKAAFGRLEASDAVARRHDLQSLRRYDDDWFFQRFRRELTVDLSGDRPR
jgi:GT2 family glycosyltransferase